jgi:aspartyl-tRNA(Asn)/glutamyl-tRNA(Gln) amidotransferase subunit C
MTLSRDDVLNIARLSRIEIAESEIEDYSRSLGKILDFFNQLNELDTCAVEPMLSAAPDNNVFRDDSPGISLTPDAALLNAPQRIGDMFGVPTVIE